MTPEESIASRIERADSTTYFHFSSEERARLVAALRSGMQTRDAVIEECARYLDTIGAQYHAAYLRSYALSSAEEK